MNAKRESNFYRKVLSQQIDNNNKLSQLFNKNQNQLVIFLLMINLMNNDLLLTNIERFITKKVEGQQNTTKKIEKVSVRGTIFQNLRKKSNLLLNARNSVASNHSKSSKATKNPITNNQNKRILKKYIKRKKIPQQKKQKWLKTFNIISSEGLYQNKSNSFDTVCLRDQSFDFSNNKTSYQDDQDKYEQRKKIFSNTVQIARRAKTQIKYSYFQIGNYQTKMIERNSIKLPRQKYTKLSEILNHSFDSDSLAQTINQQNQKKDADTSKNLKNIHKFLSINRYKNQRYQNRNKDDDSNRELKKKLIDKEIFNPAFLENIKIRNLPPVKPYAFQRQQKITPWINENQQFDIF